MKHFVMQRQELGYWISQVLLFATFFNNSILSFSICFGLFSSLFVIRQAKEGKGVLVWTSVKKSDANMLWQQRIWFTNIDRFWCKESRVLALLWTRQTKGDLSTQMTTIFILNFFFILSSLLFMSKND